MHIYFRSFSVPSFLLAACLLTACETGLDSGTDPLQSDAVNAMFNGRIDLNDLDNYAAQDVPDYVNRDNTEGNTINNITATLGRVLSYDTKLSSDRTVSCAS